jgi:hypothetical protein
VTVELATGIVIALGCYGAAGAAFGLAFVSLGIARVDPAAQRMPLAARLLILPGVAALWPLMLHKWLARKAPPVA